MNLLIHDLAAAIEREACDDPGSSDQLEMRGVSTYDRHRPISPRDAIVPERPVRHRGS